MAEVGQVLCLHFEVIAMRINIVVLRSSYALTHELSKPGFRKSLAVPFLVYKIEITFLFINISLCTFVMLLVSHSYYH